MRIPVETLREQPGVQGLVQLAHNAIDRINDLERALRDCVEWMEAQPEPRMIGCHDRVRTARTLLANQQKTSGSPMAEQPAQPQRWAVFCAGCRKEWSVAYEHPGMSVCCECASKATGGEA